VKHFRLLLPLLILILLLSTCQSTSGEPYTVSIDSNRTASIHPDSGTIRYGNDIYRYKVSSLLSRTRYIFTYPDGQRYTWTESKETGEGTWSEEWNPTIYLDRDFLIRALKESAPRGPKYFRDQEGNPVAGILCIVAGLLLIVFHKHGATSGRRRFVRFGSSGRYGVEVSPEEYAAHIFVDGVVLLFVGLILCFI
jgi:hypothetical protein